ncbi:hypothetical protein [Burkholderia sp. Bp9143]|uniref:hypothetical protein n=1 Tax=Burkholderia sp. Bp9143 TaxID=2184574 RepID=UPI00162A50BD|nr:hypothetical protein [Burkholderia sp. Bp9143]
MATTLCRAEGGIRFSGQPLGIFLASFPYLLHELPNGRRDGCRIFERRQVSGAAQHAHPRARDARQQLEEFGKPSCPMHVVHHGRRMYWLDEGSGTGGNLDIGNTRSTDDQRFARGMPRGRAKWLRSSV